MPEMLEAEIWTIIGTDQGSAVLLRPLGSDIAVPVFVGRLEAQAILIGGGKTKVKRPLTHDLFLSLLGQIGFSLNRVEVHALRDNIFYARLIIFGGNFSEKNPLILDSRPSDAFALALRRQSPIFVSRRVIEQAGVPADIIMDRMDENFFDSQSSIPDREPAFPSPPDSYEDLLEDLNKAVAAEEYERAAEIRDMLILLDNERKNREGG
jgi:bifunctional DNase/RNase